MEELDTKTTKRVQSRKLLITHVLGLIPKRKRDTAFEQLLNDLKEGGVTDEAVVLMDNRNDRWRRIILAAHVMKRSDDCSVCAKRQT